MATPSPICAITLARRAANSSGGKMSVKTGWANRLAPSVTSNASKSRECLGIYLLRVKKFHMCKRLTPQRRVAAPEFRRGFQPTGRLENVPASRQRRLNSIVADATWKHNDAHRGLKPTSKFRRRYAAKNCLHRPKNSPAIVAQSVQIAWSSP